MVGIGSRTAPRPSSSVSDRRRFWVELSLSHYPYTMTPSMCLVGYAALPSLLSALRRARSPSLSSRESSTQHTTIHGHGPCRRRRCKKWGPETGVIGRYTT